MKNVVCVIRKNTAEFRNESKTCNEDCDEANKTKKQHRKNNPEKVALQRKKRLQRIGGDRDITCPICQYDVENYKFDNMKTQWDIKTFQRCMKQVKM